MPPIKENELMSRKLKACENCEWCIMQEFPHCLLKHKIVGLFNTCECFKWRTGNHISM